MAASPTMQLDLDLGNTRIKWRLSACQSTLKSDQQSACVTGVAFYDEGILTAVANVTNQSGVKIGRVRIACVAGPERLEKVIAQCRHLCRREPELARVIRECAGVRAGYRDLSHLGVDRWLGLLAAYQHYQSGCVVVGCGTAVTVDLVDAMGQHLGGYIVPGFELMRGALYSNTNAVRIEQLQAPDDLSPGDDTAPAVNKGLLLMIKALVDNACARLQQDQTAVATVLTGGDAPLLQAFFNGQCDYNEHLVLDGLAVALP